MAQSSWHDIFIALEFRLVCQELSLPGSRLIFSRRVWHFLYSILKLSSVSINLMKFSLIWNWPRKFLDLENRAGNSFFLFVSIVNQFLWHETSFLHKDLQKGKALFRYIEVKQYSLSYSSTITISNRIHPLSIRTWPLLHVLWHVFYRNRSLCLNLISLHRIAIQQVALPFCIPCLSLDLNVWDIYCLHIPKRNQDRTISMVAWYFIVIHSVNKPTLKPTVTDTQHIN